MEEREKVVSSIEPQFKNKNIRFWNFILNPLLLICLYEIKMSSSFWFIERAQ